MIASLLFRLKALSIYEGIDVVNVRARNADMKQIICNYLFGVPVPPAKSLLYVRKLSDRSPAPLWVLEVNRQ